MASFNLTSLRSKSSPMAHKTSQSEHDIAHEVLLVAILSHISQAEGSNKSLMAIRQTVEELIGKSNPNSTRIASDLINDAAEFIKK